MNAALRYAGKYVRLVYINSDCTFDVGSCCDGSYNKFFPHNVFQRIENTTVEFRDNMWKIRNLCREKKEDEIGKLISSFPIGPTTMTPSRLNETQLTNQQVDKLIWSQNLNSKHRILKSKTIEFQAEGIAGSLTAVLNETFVHGIQSEDVIRLGNLHREHLGINSVVYTGNLTLSTPLVDGSISLTYLDNGNSKTTKIQVHSTTEQDIVLSLRITYNTLWKRILYTILTYEDDSQKFLPASIDCPFDLYSVCQKHLQPLADSVFSNIKQELLWIMETRIKNARIE